MKGYLKMVGVTAFLWLMVQLGPHLEPVVDWLVPRLMLPAGVGCFLGVAGVYGEITVNGLILLRREAEQRNRSKPSVAA